MPEVRIQGGMRLMVPDRGEHRDDLRAVLDEQEKERERARSFKPMRIASPGPSPAAKTVFVPLPEQGYAWNLKLVSVQLASADTVQLFIATSAPSTTSVLLTLISNFGASATSQVDKWSASQVILNPGEGLYIAAAAQNITAFCILADQAVAEMVYKLYD